MRAILFLSLSLAATLISAATLLQSQGAGFLDPVEGAGSWRRGDGQPRTQTRPVAPFEAIDLRIPARLEYRPGEATLSLRADANLLEILDTEVVAGVLVISARQGFGTANPIVIHSGSAGLRAAALAGGEMYLAGLAASGLELRVRGSGRIRVAGTARVLDAAIQGSGAIDAGALRADDCRLALQGAGRIGAFCDGRLDARLLGSGAIRVAGDPRVAGLSTLGSGRVYLDSARE